MRKFEVCVAWLGIACGAPVTLQAQFASQPAGSPIALGIGVDTLASGSWGRPWQAQATAVYRRWAEFLSSTAPRYTLLGAALSPYWDAGEQHRWITFPLALNISGGQGAATVLDVRPASPGTDSVFVVKTLFSGADAQRLPLALVRVYAVRQRGSWVFSNALPRMTRTWSRVAVGSFIYVMPPGYPFRRDRAQAATAFADSLARVFNVERAQDVEYYLTESPDEMNRIVGLDWMPSATDGGAFSSGPNHLLVSGNPIVGENYRHEIVHVVLSSFALGGVHPLVWEGVATWLGGTLGMSTTETRKAYARYLRQHPEVTLEGLLHSSTDQGFRAGGAVLAQMAFVRRGTEGVKALLRLGRSDDDLKGGVQRILGLSWPATQSAWRQAALKQGG